MKKEKSVTVRKANIPLMAGETLSGFTNALDREGKNHIFTALGLDKKNSWTYIEDVYQKTVVFCVSSKNADYSHYSLSYERNKEGEFSFGDLVKVERVVSYKPMKNDIVIKSVSWKKTAQDIWQGVV